MQVIIGVDPHKASHTAVAIGDDEPSSAAVKVRGDAAAGRRSCWRGRSRSRSGRGRSSPRAGSAICCRSSSSPRARRSSMCRRRWRRGCGCWARAGRTRTTRTTRWSVAIAALRAPALRSVDGRDHGEVLRLLAKRNIDIGSHRTRVVCRLHALLAELAPGGIAKELNASDADRAPRPDPAGQPGRADPLRPGGRTPRRRPPPRRANSRRRTNASATPSPRREQRVTDIFGVGPIIAAIADRLHRRRRRFAQPRPLRRLQRHRTDRALLGRPNRAPALAARQPPTQPRDAHGRHQPDPPTPHRRPRLLRPQASPRARPRRKRSAR